MSNACSSIIIKYCKFHLSCREKSLATWAPGPWLWEDATGISGVGVRWQDQPAWQGKAAQPTNLLIGKGGGSWRQKTLWFLSSFYCLLLPFHNRKSIFAVLHSDIDSLKSGLRHLTGQPYRKKTRSAKVKGGIINLILRNISLIDTDDATIIIATLGRMTLYILHLIVTLSINASNIMSLSIVILNKMAIRM